MSTSVDNCKLYNTSKDECLGCNLGFFLSEAKCVAVTTSIDNCVSYKSQTECIGCGSGFIISNKVCTQITGNGIANCQDYFSQTTCSKCSIGNLLSFDLKSCTTTPSSSNCLGHNWVSCTKCDSTTIQNENLPYVGWSTSSFIANIKSLFGLQLTDNVMVQSVCQATIVDFCDVFVDFQTCQTCMKGYFLTEAKKCQAFPKEVISGCLDYSAERVCTRCIQGKYKKNSTECIDVTQVDNCVNYSQTHSSTKCMECDQTHWVKSPTVC
ncbi:MAG: hypothetical protein GY938_09005 [Ketobacter sp.]|nr:hypothetical protein [Ketobacter sp.]